MVISLLSLSLVSMLLGHRRGRLSRSGQQGLEVSVTCREQMSARQWDWETTCQRGSEARLLLAGTKLSLYMKKSNILAINVIIKLRERETEETY